MTAFVTRSCSSKSRTAAASNSVDEDRASRRSRGRGRSRRCRRRGTSAAASGSPGLASNTHSGEDSAAAARLRCVVRTPFGTPVVPDVYICSDRVAGRPATAWIDRVLRGQQALVVRPGRLHHAHGAHRCAASSSATLDVRRRRRGARGAPESVETVASSGEVRRQLSGTVTAPILLAAEEQLHDHLGARSGPGARRASPAPTPAAAQRAAPAGSTARRARRRSAPARRAGGALRRAASGPARGSRPRRQRVGPLAVPTELTPMLLEPLGLAYSASQSG